MSELNLPGVCTTFPGQPENEIARPQLLAALDSVVSKRGELLTVRSGVGGGKTVILSQFARWRSHRSISLFVRASSPLTWDIDIVREELLSQIVVATGDGSSADSDPSAESLRRAAHRLLRRARHDKEPFYFVIDGLDEIAHKNPEAVRAIIGSLEIGVEGFRFLFSGDDRVLREFITRSSPPISPFELPPFGHDEVRRYMGDVIDDEGDFRRIYDLSGGTPGYVAALRRMLLKGEDLNSLIANSPFEIEAMIELEWNTNTQGLSAHELQALALIAWAQTSLAKEELLDALGAEVPASIVKSLDRLTFLKRESNGRFDFVSEAFRGYARSKLQEQRDRVIELLTSRLLEDPTSLSALRLLPRYFAEAGRHEDLLQFLSDDRIAALVRESGSTVPAEEQVKSAMVSATALHRQGDKARFALQLSVLRSLAGLDVWESEVQARAALGDWEAAYALARSASLAEDRLLLLALVARKRREDGFEPTDDQLAELRRAISELPQGLNRERAAEIASVLVHIIPEEAVKLVRGASSEGDDESDINWTFALLAITASVQTNSLEEEAFDKIKLHITDPTVRSIPERASLLLGARPAKEFVQEIGKIESVDDRMFLVQQWLALNDTAEDVSEVIEYALTTAVTSPDFDLNASVLARLSEPLPTISDTERIEAILGLLESVAARVRDRGPTEEYVRVQVRMAETEWRFQPEAAKDRLLNVAMYDVAEVEDLGVRFASSALLLAALRRLQRNAEFEDPDLINFVQDTYYSARDLTLAGTADHFGVAKGAVRSLAVHCTDEVAALARSLNTAKRRSYALREIIQRWAREAADKLPWSTLLGIVRAIEIEPIRDQSVTLLTRLAARDQVAVDQGELFQLESLIHEISDSVERSKAACFLLIACNRHTDQDAVSPLTPRITEIIETSWKSIDNAWERVDIAFKIAQLIASASPDLSREYLKQAEIIRQGDWLHGGATAESYMAVVRLLIRVYAGLVRSGAKEDGDYQTLRAAIDRIPSAGERAVLWAETALRCVDASEEEARGYVIEHVEPLIEDLPRADRANRDSVIADVAPALYLVNKETTVDLLRTTLPHLRETAVRNIVEWVANRKAPRDPYEYVFGSSDQASYDELRRVVDLLSLCEEDTQLFFNIVSLVDAAAPLRGNPVLSRVQRDRLAQLFTELVAEKLPDPANITHEGYSIAATAHIGRLRNEKNGAFWEDLIGRAEKISNTSDQSYVLGFIALNMTSTKFHLKRVELMKAAQDKVKQIPSRYDAVGRLEALAEVAYPFDSQLTRQLLKAGMESAAGVAEGGRIDPRALLDVAHKVDPDFAASLSKMFDDDRSEPRSKARLKHRMELMRVRRQLLDEPAKLNREDVRAATLSAAAWRSLGSLVARRVPPQSAADAAEALRLAAGMHLDDSYALYAWYLENLIRHPAETGHGTRYLHPAFQGVALSAELLAKIAGAGRQDYRRIEQKRASESLLVKAGAREGAIRFIAEWLRDGVEDAVKVCDPYFGPGGLDLVRLIREADRDCHIQILTSRKHQQQLNLQEPWEEAYRTAWRSISDASAGVVDVVVAGIGSGGQLPIHDRWILSGGRGLRLGTSYNALGKSRESELSIMAAEEASDREREVDGYLNRDRRTHSGEQLRYTIFSI